MGGGSGLSNPRAADPTQPESLQYKAQEAADETARQDALRKKLTDANSTGQAADLAAGKARGEELFSSGSLGRVSEGYSPEEMNAFRSQNLNASNQAQQGSSRALATAQGSSGVYGALAAAQKARMLTDANNANSANETNLFASNIAAKREDQKYNLAQGAAEKAGQLTTQMGYGSLGSGDRAGINEAVLGDAQARASIAAANKGGSGGLCCFIFLEARYGTGQMDQVVRRFRDERMTDKNRRGYYKLAEVLVPLMRKSEVMKWAVRICMTDPCVSYGKHYYSRKGIGWIFKPVATFWLKMFEYLGGEHPFIRENGEVI